MKNLRNRNYPVNADLVQVYLESAWDKVEAVYAQLANIEDVADAINDGTLGNYLTAGDIDTLAELNTIVTDATLGDAGDFATAAQGVLADNSVQLPFASQAEAEAGSDNTKPMTPLRVAQAITALTGIVQNGFNEVTDPTVTDDSSGGWAVGSVWINTVSDETYRCVDNTIGAALWIKTTLSADELATIAFSGDSDDLVEGAVNLLLTSAERTKLGTVETGATADQTGAEIKTAYEGEADTNAFTDALLGKLNGIEAAAQVNRVLASQAEAEAGVENTKGMTPLRVAQAIAALGGGGAGGLAAMIKSANYTAVAADFIFADTSGGAWTLTLPATPSIDDLVVVKDLLGTCGTNPVTVDGNGADTINGNLNAYLDTPYATLWMIWDGTEWKATADGFMLQGPTEHMSFALSDETSDLTTGTAKLTTRAPYMFFVTDVRASVNTAPVGADIQVDINQSGVSIFSSGVLTIDAGEKTSTTSAVSNPMGISVIVFDDDEELTFDIDQVGSTTAGKGLKVTIEGYRTQV